MFLRSGLPAQCARAGVRCNTGTWLALRASCSQASKHDKPALNTLERSILNTVKWFLALVAGLVVLPAVLLAVDGQVLINQAAVTAAGGFPYKITQPGSYKLSGNLVMNTFPGGNYSGMDVAILINSSNVTLDLNGFSIMVNDTMGVKLGHPFYGIAEAAAYSQVTIKNGSVRITTNTDKVVLTAINMPSSVVTDFEDLNLAGKAPSAAAAPYPVLMLAGRRWCINPVTDKLGSGGAALPDALRNRPPEFGHAVDDRTSNPGFDLLRLELAGPQCGTDQGLVAEHRRFDQ
jgi:hypothetical protein